MVPGEISPETIKNCPAPLNGWRRLCHDADGMNAKLEIQSQDDWLYFEMEQKWKPRAGKPAFLGQLQ